MIKKGIGGLIFLMTLNGAAWGKTLVIEGNLDGTVTVRKNVTFSLDKPLDSLSYQFPIPSGGEGRETGQHVSAFSSESDPRPDSTGDGTDKFGNRYRKVNWKKLSGDTRITISFTAAVHSELSPRRSYAPFPVRGGAGPERIYLKETALVQASAPQVRELAGSLTSGETTQYGAVNTILNHVSDAITYQYTPPKYDALYGLETGRGNCQNYAHLALALLRASGIPARLVVGLTLKDKWKIPLDDHGSSLVQGMGEGLHAWIEVYFPDLGWLPCDPQQSRFFTSTRHIKYGHGLDAGDIKEFWQGSPSLPRFSDSLEAHYSDDKVSLQLRSTGEQPDKRYMLSALTVAAGPPAAPVKAAKPGPVPEKTAPRPDAAIELGNTDFPALLEVYQESGDTGTRSFERETAEYATSRTVFAQAFTVEHPLQVSQVSLALKKFGGDGMVYLDLVADDQGKPGLAGVRSVLVSLDKLRRAPGYGWVDFPIPPGTRALAPGKYWVVLRHSGEAILNWFYTPGKRYGGPDDSRSTALGWRWEDVLTYDFVFRVRGKAAGG
jgi:transglutaminase-like putative cysteine protease